MAARFGATIVPFAAVGIDDSLNILLDPSQVQALPFVGDALRRRQALLPQVTPWVGGRDLASGSTGGRWLTGLF